MGNLIEHFLSNGFKPEKKSNLALKKEILNGYIVKVEPRNDKWNQATDRLIVSLSSKRFLITMDELFKTENNLAREYNSRLISGDQDGCLGSANFTN